MLSLWANSVRGNLLMRAPPPPQEGAPLMSHPGAPLMRRLHTSQQHNTKMKKDREFA